MGVDTVCKGLGQGGKDKGSGVLKVVLMTHLTIFSTWNGTSISESQRPRK